MYQQCNKSITSIDIMCLCSGHLYNTTTCVCVLVTCTTQQRVSVFWSLVQHNNMWVWDAVTGIHCGQ